MTSRDLALALVVGVLFWLTIAACVGALVSSWLQ